MIIYKSKTKAINREIKERKQMEINEEKRKKFMEYAGKRVNNVLHDIQILEPMARSSSYDFTRQDVEEMFSAMQETLNDAKEEFNKKFEEKAKATKKVFSFGANPVQEVEEVAVEVAAPVETQEEATEETNITEEIAEETDNMVEV